MFLKRLAEVWCHHYRDLDWLAGAMSVPSSIVHGWIFTKMHAGAEESKSKWRRVLKTLNLLEFLIKNGSERIIDEVRREQFKVMNMVMNMVILSTDSWP